MMKIEAKVPLEKYLQENNDKIEVSEKKLIVSVFLDLARAFNIVNYKNFLLKLNCYNIKFST